MQRKYRATIASGWQILSMIGQSCIGSEISESGIDGIAYTVYIFPAVPGFSKRLDESWIDFAKIPFNSPGQFIFSWNAWEIFLQKSY